MSAAGFPTVDFTAPQPLNIPTGQNYLGGQLGIGTPPSNAPNVMVTIRRDAKNASSGPFSSITFQNLTTGATDSLFQEAFAFQTLVSGSLSDSWSLQLDPNHQRKEELHLKYRGSDVIICGKSAPVNGVLTDTSVLFQTAVYVQNAGNLQALVLQASGDNNEGLSIQNSVQNWTLGLRHDLSEAFNLRDLTGGNDVVNVSTAGVITVLDGGGIAAGTSTGFKLGTSGGSGGQKLGFFGHAPATQPLLATGAGHTVDDVITSLQSLGIVRQS